MFRRHARTIAAVVLCVFTWTSGGVFTVAHAAQDALKKGKAQEQQKSPEGTEERFSRLTEELTVLLADPNIDVEEKKQRLVSGRTEMDALDKEIKKQFVETEKRLKDAKLPAEILERHYRFVKHYEDNFAEFKGNVERVEKAKDKMQAEAEIEKMRSHLEKVKAPSRHQPLDPNNLPHRQPKVIKREPRMKKEEFERDLKKDKQAWRNEKRILLASTSTTGLLAPEDLAETIEVQFTPEIRAKALELGNNPVKIYEWVRNNVEFIPTWGSIQGAQMTLLSKQGNAFDTASLLIALLRAAGIRAHYVTGTIDVPIEKVMNWGGGFSDPVAALNFIASGGVPVTGMRSGGKVVSARMEHAWVEAFVDYVPSLGAVHKEGDTWIPLDASFKQFTYSEGIDVKTLVSFGSKGFADQLKASATVNEQEGYVTNVSSSLVQSTLSDYITRLENYVTQNLPNASAADILGKKEILKKEQAILPASLPYKVVVAGVETTEVPARYRHRVGISFVNTYSSSLDGFDDGSGNPVNDQVSYATSLAQLAGKRITISYDPATQTDKAIIDQYAAKKATTLPAYLVQVKPVLKIENTIVATGPVLGMGTAQSLSVSLSSPNNLNIITHNLFAGDYTAIALNPSKITLDVLQSRIDQNDYSEPVGEMLHQTALSYWGEVDALNHVIANTLRVRNLRHPSELAATAKISLSWLWGIRAYGTYKSRNIDVKLDNQSVVGKAIDNVSEFKYMQQSGAYSSFLEGAVLDQLFGKNIGDSISAVSAMKLANDQGVLIYQVNSSNVATVLPKLQISEDVRNEVVNAINAGLTVQIPRSDITRLGWTGVGYIVTNPGDGSGAYRISGGLNGGDSLAEGATVVPLPLVPLAGPVAFIIGSLLASSERVVIGDCSNLQTAFTAQSFATTTSQCLIVKPLISLASSITLGTTVPVAIALADILLMCLIFAVVIAVAITMPPDYQSFRHYTTYNGAAGIWSSREIWVMEGWFNGDLIVPGAYVTDFFLEPDTIENRTLIATVLRMPPNEPDPSTVQTYIDIKIDRNRVLLLSLSPLVYPHQYLHPFSPLIEDLTRVIFTGHGPISP